MWSKTIVFEDGKHCRISRVSTKDMTEERATTKRCFTPGQLDWVNLFVAPDVIIDYNTDGIICIYMRTKLR